MRERMNLVALAGLPKIAPLDSAEILLVRFGHIAIQEFGDLSEVVLFQVFLGHPHVRCIGD